MLSWRLVETSPHGPMLTASWSLPNQPRILHRPFRHRQLAGLVDGSTPERRAEIDRTVSDELIPALQTEPGYSGALNVRGQASGDQLTIVLRQREAQACRALAEHGPPSRAWDVV
jgi:hypothetical protein